ncbi:RHS repeat-associated core domain-containing protein [Streptomyces sp. UNOC14_S4]|uniref:RHS repeat-associated core domain-containing protein n=1 Tax=Streptomyces sp. UNOC14_S4 TaxID=2872340 RepID=UPI001E545CB7|nr:RHS repeat-associated core domain-containing protein [Streptomyces sp. UNOC14_S4]MCC3766281.1 RHS repeat protein [Streptomyces sp. UNOC14_S4]
MTLDQRRAQVQRERFKEPTSAADRSQRGTAAEAEKAAAAAHNAARKAAGNATEQSASGSNPPWGVPADLRVVGSEGSYRAVLDARPGHKGGALTGQVFPGEKVAVATVMQNSDNKTVNGQWVDTLHKVKVTWGTRCGSVEHRYDLNQVVTTHSSTFSALNPGTDDPIVTLDAPVDPDCTQAGNPGLPAFNVWATGTVTDSPDGENSGSLYVNMYAVQGIPDDQTYGCATDCRSSSTGFAQPQMTRGSINAATGAFANSFNDILQKSPGGGFDITRRYSSNNMNAGSFGQGWAAPWDSSLKSEDNGDVTFTAESGSKYLYHKGSDGSFTGPVTTRSTLKRLTDGSYSLSTPQQRTLSFDSDGRLTASKNRSGQGIRFTYTGRHLTSATDSAGRTSTATYSGDLLTQLKLTNGRHVDYDYTDGRLTTVTATDKSKTVYGYDSQGHLDAVKDANGNYPIRNSYDAQGRVISQKSAVGEVTSYSYKSGETDTTTPDGGVWSDIYSSNILTAQYDPFGNKTSYNYDGLVNISYVTDALGNRTTFGYDGSGYLTKKTTAGGSTEQYTYDGNGNVTKATDAGSHATAYEYDSGNLLTSVKDALGNTAKFTYTPAGLPETVTSPLAKVTRYAYDAAGNQVSLTAADSSKTTRTFDGSGRLLTVTDPRGNASDADPAKFTTTYTYDDADRVASVTSPPMSAGSTGGVTRYVYDAVGNLTSVTDSAGNTSTYTYDAANRLTAFKDAAGNVSTRSYDAMGNLSASVDATGAKTTYAYDKAGRLLAMTTPRGNSDGSNAADYTWKYGYDQVGNQLTVTNPSGGTAATEYDVEYRPVTLTDPLGNSSKVKYDAVGNTVQTTDASGKITAYTFDANSRLTGIKDPNRNTATFAYDADGNRISQTTPLGYKTTYRYDDNGRLSATVDPRGNVTGADPAAYTWSTAYDTAGNPVSQTDPLGNVTKSSYDALNNVVSSTDPLGNRKSFEYDALNRLTKVTGPDGGATAYDHDVLGNVTTRTDANGHTATYTYDRNSRLIGTTDPLKRSVAYTYDPDGNQTSVRNARGITTTASYNSRGLLSGLAYSDATPKVTYTYDAADHITNVSDGTGSRTLTYTPVGRLAAVTPDSGKGGFTYDYDDAGRLKSKVTVPTGAAAGTRVTYKYDADGRQTAQANPGGTTNYDYDAAGNLTSTTLPTGNGHVEKRSYDAAGRLTAIGSTKAGATLANWQLALNATGQPTRIDATRAGQADTSQYYTYDPAGRLLTECLASARAETCPKPGPDIAYTYDKAGNRTTQTVGSASTTYTYDSADQLTSAAAGSGTRTFAYDADGNQTGIGPDTAAYDAANRLTTLKEAGGNTFAFTYDADGNRTTASKAGTLQRTTQWDINSPLPQVATETNGSGGVIGNYAYNPVGQIESTLQGTAAFYYHHDGLGSVTELTDGKGTNQYRYRYDGFGNLTADKLTSNPPSNPFTYTGQYKEPTSSTLGYNLRARSYAPDQGRFLSRDPVSRSQSEPYVADYAYADNQPTSQTDPSGRCPTCVSAGIGAAFGALIEGGSYTWKHRNDGQFSLGGLAKTSGKGALTGGIAGLLMPGTGNLAARTLGLTGARGIATSGAVNAALGAGYSWALNTTACRPADPWDLILGAAGGGSSSLLGPASRWLKGLFGSNGERANVGYRALRPGESPKGISRPGSNPDVEPWQHVMEANNSPWISLTRDPEVMYNRYGEGGPRPGAGSDGYVAVDLNSVDSEMADVAQHLHVPDHIKALGLDLGETAFRDRELLVKFEIQHGSILKYWKPGTSLEKILRDIRRGL